MAVREGFIALYVYSIHSTILRIYHNLTRISVLWSGSRTCRVSSCAIPLKHLRLYLRFRIVAPRNESILGTGTSAKKRPPSPPPPLEIRSI